MAYFLFANSQHTFKTRRFNKCADFIHHISNSVRNAVRNFIKLHARVSGINRYTQILVKIKQK